jgi:hypothetical protein
VNKKRSSISWHTILAGNLTPISSLKLKWIVAMLEPYIFSLERKYNVYVICKFLYDNKYVISKEARKF